MNLKISKSEEKPLLARKEVSGHMMFEGKATPSNGEVKKAIASELKADENNVVVKHIYTGFGSCEADVEAYVYNTAEDLKRIEPKTKKDREAGKKPAEGEEASAEGAAEAKPEEKKEEAAEKPAKEKAKPEEKKAWG